MLRDDRPDLSALTDRELADRYFHLMDTHFRDLFAHHIFISYMATLPVGILSAMAAAVGDPSLMMRLIGGLGQVDSAAPSMAMWDMGRVVAESPVVDGRVRPWPRRPPRPAASVAPTRAR